MSQPERPPGGRRLVTPSRLAVLAVIVAAAALVVVVLQSGGTKSGSPSPTVARRPQGRAATPIARLGTPEAAYPQTLTGADGSRFTLPAQPRRIVALAPGVAEILYAIGAGGQIAGVVAEPDYPPTMAAAPQLDPAAPGSVQALQPDLIVLGDSTQALAPALRGQGLPAIALDAPNTVAGVLQQIQYFGNVTNHLSEAQALAAKLRARLDAVQRKLNGAATGPRVYDEAGTGQRAAGPSSLTGDLLTLLRAQNIALAGVGPQAQLSTEQVMASDPEVIVISTTGPGETIDEVKARQGWSSITAVTTNRVYSVDPALAGRPGPRIVDGLEALAKLLYPNTF